MFNQTLRSICSFFSPGKKNIFSSANAAGSSKQENKNTDKQNIHLLYHHDTNNIQAIEAKPEAMQHDWWIN